jgi:4-amino-4-deoxy-L-arabinose transferase-like glycosyltransferase
MTAAIDGRFMLSLPREVPHPGAITGARLSTFFDWVAPFSIWTRIAHVTRLAAPHGIIAAVSAPSLGEPAVLRRWPLAVLIVVAIHLAFGIFGRVLWKPDEPREAAIAARMARPGADWIVPHLGTTPFCEKPPLVYWAAAGSMRALGVGPVQARLPNLAYALAGALLAGALARAASGRTAALASGVLMGTFYLAYRIEIWLATDALLMTAVAGALYGCFRGLSAARGRAKLGWYTLMHAFLAVGFLTKNVVAWIVPGLALLVFVAWERRWRELLAWELYAGLAVEVVAGVPWVLAVAAEPNGAAYLRVFFVDNLFGRFTALPGVGYAESHRGWVGKYLVELPIYVAPWTFAMAAAVAAAWRGSRLRATGGDPGALRERGAWRFALASVVPGLVVLSASTTMRDIYAGVLMPGLALLGGLWAARALASSSRLDRAMTRATSVLVAAVAVLLPAATAVLAVRVATPVRVATVAAAAVLWVGALVVAGKAWKTARSGSLARALAACAAAWVLTVLAAAPVLFPLLNRAQDLSPVAVAARSAAQGAPLVLWQPDETTIATLDFYASLTPPIVTSDEQLAARLAAAPDLRVLTEVTPGRGKERRPAELARAFGLVVERRIELPAPGGRSYAILGLPGR